MCIGETMEDFGSKLKQLRQEHRITQRDLADRIGKDFTYISKMENDKLENSPSEDTIKKIALVLETDSDELILLAKKVPTAMREKIVDDDLAATFLRKVSNLTSEQRKNIKDIIDPPDRVE
jgi:transcriptional regulator with XRE-family HTH domain